jgi:peroxiredoxin
VKSTHRILKSAVSIAVVSTTTLLIAACAGGPRGTSADTARLAPGGKVDNFRLRDSAGASHQLYYLSDKKAVVLIAQGNSCAANAKSAAELKALNDKYRAQSVEFLMINSNLGESREAILEAAKKQGLELPIMMDETQLIGESLSLRNNGEVLVVNPKDWTLAYRGNTKGTAAALDAVLAGAAVATPSTSVSGCDINMPEMAKRAAHASISYEKTIAPMLVDNCVTCHRQGGIGPWAMTSYEVVKGFSPMIREVLRTERMPPWHADPHYGTFKNNRALSAANVKALVHWIEAGSPRGEGSDPLANLKKSWPEWALGQPDLVLELPAYEVPATGVVPYQDVRVKNTIGRDVWLRAIDYAPGDRSVVHHILGYTLPPGAAAGQLGASRDRPAPPPEVPGQPGPQSLQLIRACSTPAGAAQIRSRIGGNGQIPGGASIGGYVPGAAPAQFPPEAGVLLKKDSDFRFQLHYTPTGKVTKDVTRVGIYFSDAAPTYPLRNSVLMDPCLQIPANTKAYTASMSRTIDRDMLIYSMTPHSHFRGAASIFTAEYPDGTKETLLSVPNYDFNWQTTYAFATPKKIPKGTKITHSTTYDNSSLNKANPDPNQVVHWGEQTWEEMLYGNISFRYLDETVDAQKTSQVAP